MKARFRAVGALLQILVFEREDETRTSLVDGSGAISLRFYDSEDFQTNQRYKPTGATQSCKVPVVFAPVTCGMSVT